MTQDEAINILRNGLVNAPNEHDWCIAFKMAIKSLENEEELLKENRVLKNRCRVQTRGLLCSFCPLECEQRAEDYRGKVND